MKPKLCVCGRSNKLPLCDNSHESEGWSCSAPTERTPLLIAASSRYLNLAKKLAFHYGGRALEPAESTAGSAERLLVLVDPTDLDELRRTIESLQADEIVAFVVGFDPTLVQPLFPSAELRFLDDSSPLAAFHSVRRQLEERQAPNERADWRWPSTFVSHAVADEGRLLGAVEYLRQHFCASLFVCSDSIAPGSAWQDEIVGALRAAERFVAVVSEASLRSHFCSFEGGMAQALEKPLRLLSLDGSRPPLFFAQLQCIDLRAIQQRRPWLSDDDVVVDALIRCCIE
ncbi:MAG: TIR domain-containing protein [Myxococcales bacterium]|nr:TIR domain-containing protein [Myxococcales bacterium]